MNKVETPSPAIGLLSPQLPDIEKIQGFLSKMFYNKFENQISTMDYLATDPKFESYHNLKAAQV